jgi:flagellar biosynthetic protein FlhB
VAKEERTEKPTAKRKKEARKNGQVAKSPDVSAWLILLAGTSILPILVRAARAKLTDLVGLSTTVMANPSQAGALHVLSMGLTDVVALVLPTVGAFAVVGVAANVAQTGPMLNLSGPKPKFSKLNPITGAKNLFSTSSLWKLGKEVAKLSVLVGLAYSAVAAMGHKLVGSSPDGIAPVVAYSATSMLALCRQVAMAGLVLAAADYFWQRHKIGKAMKMTKQEVKDEARQADGDRMVKGQIRKRQMGLSRSRMMAAVAGADVIVMNPTHFAVALKYDPVKRGAPTVVAKGMDSLALRIKDEGLKHKVPVVEDPPLARAVYAACDVDDSIPPELFLAVARLLAFVFTLSPIVKAAGMVHRRPTTAMVA